MQAIKVEFGSYLCRAEMPDRVPCEDADWNADRHCHIAYEVYIVLRGSCTTDVAETTYRLTRGDALLIAPQEYHGPKTMSDDYAQFTLSFSCTAKQETNAAFATFPMALSDFDLQLCEKIAAELNGKPPYYQETVSALYTLLLGSIFRKINAQGEADGRKDALFDNRYLQIDDFFERHLASDSSEQALAQRIGLSVRQLSRVLNERYGMGFRRKLNSARLDKAAWLLRTTNMTVSAICDAIGYQSEPSFFKAFHKQYHCTPKTYRKNKIC